MKNKNCEYQVCREVEKAPSDNKKIGENGVVSASPENQKIN